jgi:hypothetical protein
MLSSLTTRPPLSWEPTLLEGCLRAVPEFISSHKPGDTTKYAVTVPVTSGKLDFVLSWVEEG